MSPSQWERMASSNLGTYKATGGKIGQWNAFNICEVTKLNDLGEGWREISTRKPESGAGPHGSLRTQPWPGNSHAHLQLPSSGNGEREGEGKDLRMLSQGQRESRRGEGWKPAYLTDGGPGRDCIFCSNGPWKWDIPAPPHSPAEFKASVHTSSQFPRHSSEAKYIFPTCSFIDKLFTKLKRLFAGPLKGFLLFSAMWLKSQSKPKLQK